MGLVRYNPAIVCISGKLGGLVFYTRNGTHCVRSHVVPRDPKTERQLARRTRFAALVARWRAMEKAEKQAWNERARGSARTGFNEFLSVEMKKGGAREPAQSSRAQRGDLIHVGKPFRDRDHHVGLRPPRDDTMPFPPRLRVRQCCCNVITSRSVFHMPAPCVGTSRLSFAKKKVAQRKSRLAGGAELSL